MTCGHRKTKIKLPKPLFHCSLDFVNFDDDDGSFNWFFWGITTRQVMSEIFIGIFNDLSTNLGDSNDTFKDTFHK